MTRAWLWVCAVSGLVLLPFACSEDETTTSAGPTTTTGQPTSASSASTGTTTSAGGTSGTGGGMSAGGMSQGGNPDIGGASGMNCEDCADAAENAGCQTQFEDCMAINNGPCEQWWDCYVDQCMNGQMNGMFDAACFTACDTQFMEAATLYGPVKTCLCTECPSACLPFCP